MKKLNRYLISNVIKYLLVTELAGLVIFITIEFFEHMDIFTSPVSNFFLSVAYLFLKAPFYLNLILPLAFLISMLILLILMIRNNEIIVIRTSGISTFSLMKPLVIFSFVLILLSFSIAEFIVPFTSNVSDYIFRVKIKGEEPYIFFKNDKIWLKRENMICNIDFFDTKKDLIKGLTVLELTKNYSIKKRYDAQKGVWKDDTWYFTNVIERTFDAKGNISKKKYSQMKGIINENPSVFKVVDKNPEEMGYKELFKHIDRLKRDGHDIRRYLVCFYNKMAFPFINCIMVFAAFSVGLRYVKTRHISKGIFTGISLGILYWFFHSIALSLGYSEIFPPLFAAWFSNLLFTAVGVIGIVTLRT